MRINNEYAMSYCDVIYYKLYSNHVIPLKKNANPQSKKPSIKEYLVYRDWCLGASVMVRKKTWLKYLRLIQNKVIYAEDFSFQIMIYCGEKFINISKPFLMYEFGSGISTNGSNNWANKLKKDEDAVSEIILSLGDDLELKQEEINKYLSIPNSNKWKYRIKRLKLYPTKILYRLRLVFFPRTTSMKLNQSFLSELFEEEG